MSEGRQLKLLDVPADVPAQTESLRARLTAFKKEHGILTHYNKHCRPVQWMALLPFADDNGKSIAEICAESVGLYEECDRVVTGGGELSVVRELARLNRIDCPL